jgi:hypothetical protein
MAELHRALETGREQKWSSPQSLFDARKGLTESVQKFGVKHKTPFGALLVWNGRGGREPSEPCFFGTP